MPTLPDRFCDIVMKGGITSGVVYPLAVAKLSERFRFKSIGGTSAGAIAAAAAAAAELARSRGGFDRLRALPKFLSDSSPGGSGSNLLAFFQPQPGTRRLFRVGLAALGGGFGAAVRVVVQALSSYFLAALIGAVPGAVFGWMAWSRTDGVFGGACLFLAGLLLVAGVSGAVLLAAMRDVTRALPANFYGLCNGLTPQFAAVSAEQPPPAKIGKPLTYWLTEYLNGFVERDAWGRPLTFGELWNPESYKPGTDGMVPPRERFVNLEMMTTCLTHGRPYRLPFRDDDDVRENNQFWFNEREFRLLFPKNIVDWMVEHSRPANPDDEESVERHAKFRAAGFFPLSRPGDLPVVVAVRMSLSFPILLSAIPLYSTDRTRDPKGLIPERCWFSDGGVCSNFPVHFFDAPIPLWPTFSLDLVQKPQGTPADRLVQPEMTPTNSDGIRENWNRFEVDECFEPATDQISSKPKSGFGRLAGLVGAFIETMQNWSDQTQSRLPGFRDRIARVGLTPEEGGLNLNMPEDRITDLTERGEAAGREFIARFALPPTHPEMHWENHRWLRMRACLASVQAMLERIERACAEPQKPDIGYEERVAGMPPGEAPSYQWVNKSQHQLALHVVRELRQLAQDIASSGQSTAPNSPRPRPELRPRAQI